MTTARISVARLVQIAVLLAALVVAASSTTAEAAPGKPRAASSCAGADLLPEDSDPAQVHAATLCLINAERTSRGLRPLRAQSTLATVASRFAADMAARRFFDHTSPDGSTPLSRIKASSYLKSAKVWSVGENIAWGSGQLASPRNMVKSWMASPPHRANILRAGFTEIGIGTAAGGEQEGGTSYVTNFGHRTFGATAAKARR